MATGSIAGGTVGAADVGTIYVAGDVVWAEVKSYPWWPAVISEHEEGDKHCPHFRTFKKQYHLQFLGPYIEHQWLSARHLVPYKGADRYKDLASSYGNRPKHEIPKRFVKAWDLAVKEANVYVKERTSERRTEMLIAKLTHAQEEACKEKESEEEQILTACVFQSHTFLLNKKSLSMVENRLAELSSKNKKLKLKIEKFKMSASEAETLKQLSLDPESIIHITTTNKNEKYDKFAKVKTGPDSHMASSEATLKRSRLENVSSNTFDNAHSSSPVKKRLKLQNSDQLKELLIDAAVVDAIQKNGNKLKAVLKNHRKILENVLDEILNCNGVRRKNSENELHQQAVKRKAKQLLTLAEAARFLGESGQSPIKRSLDKIERQLQKEKQLRGETENSSTPLSSKKLQDLLPEEPPKPVDPLKPLYSDPLLKEKVCIKCETDGKSLICCIQCCNAYHVKCLDEKEVQSIDPSIGFTCMKCITGEKKCFSCKDSLANVDETSVFRCAVTNCKKFYHAKCLDKYPGLKDLTSSPEKRKNTCPQHFCASCYPHDTADNKVCYHGKIIKCLKCPVAYHSKSEDRCFPAGSVIINGYNLICPLHFPSKRSHKIRVNINWCFFCGIGGDLILCETCPAAFHLKCVKLEEKPAEGRTWSCENCSAGLVPRYNDIVWVKCGVYRWWPARIVDPEQIPDNILRQFHEDGNFVVQFFGSHDYMWTGVGRVFLYEENDKANRDSKSTSLSQSFVRGLTEASEAFRQLTIQRRENFCTKLYKSQNGSKPAPYKYVTHNIPQGDVKVMKADLDTYEVCRCRKTDPDPCGPSSGCENRMTFIECHPKLCHAGERCQNQKFAKAEYAETYYFRCGDRGWGLKNKHRLEAGQFVNEYCGDLIDYDEYNRRLKKQNERGELDFYFCFLDSKRVIDAKPKGCHSRFMNHSCDPNCEGRLWTVNGDIRVGLFARHDIPPDTELTFNYNLDSIGITDGTKKRCYCGSENCSGFIGEKPKLKQPSTSSSDSSDKEKKKQMRKKKQGLKMRKKTAEKNHEEECFRCGGEGDLLVACGKTGCIKSYHQKCVFLERRPSSWYCPRHFCDTCGKTASKFCDECDNSFCEKHYEKNISLIGANVWKCNDCLDPGCSSSAEESFTSSSYSGKENERNDSDSGNGGAKRTSAARSSPRKAVKPFCISDGSDVLKVKQEEVNVIAKETNNGEVQVEEVKLDNKSMQFTKPMLSERS